MSTPSQSLQSNTSTSPMQLRRSLRHTNTNNATNIPNSHSDSTSTENIIDQMPVKDVSIDMHDTMPQSRRKRVQLPSNGSTQTSPSSDAQPTRILHRRAPTPAKGLLTKSQQSRASSNLSLSAVHSTDTSDAAPPLADAAPLEDPSHSNQSYSDEPATPVESNNDSGVLPTDQHTDNVDCDNDEQQSQPPPQSPSSLRRSSRLSLVASVNLQASKQRQERLKQSPGRSDIAQSSSSSSVPTSVSSDEPKNRHIPQTPTKLHSTVSHFAPQTPTRQNSNTVSGRPQTPTSRTTPRRQAKSSATVDNDSSPLPQNTQVTKLITRQNSLLTPKQGSKVSSRITTSQPRGSDVSSPSSSSSLVRRTATPTKNTTSSSSSSRISSDSTPLASPQHSSTTLQRRTGTPLRSRTRPTIGGSVIANPAADTPRPGSKAAPRKHIGTPLANRKYGLKSGGLSTVHDSTPHTSRSVSLMADSEGKEHRAKVSMEKRKQRIQSPCAQRKKVSSDVRDSPTEQHNRPSSADLSDSPSPRIDASASPPLKRSHDTSPLVSDEHSTKKQRLSQDSNINNDNDTILFDDDSTCALGALAAHPHSPTPTNIDTSENELHFSLNDDPLLHSDIPHPLFDNGTTVDDISSQQLNISAYGELENLDPVSNSRHSLDRRDVLPSLSDNDMISPAFSTTSSALGVFNNNSHNHYAITDDQQSFTLQHHNSTNDGDLFDLDSSLPLLDDDDINQYSTGNSNDDDDNDDSHVDHFVLDDNDTTHQQQLASKTKLPHQHTPPKSSSKSPRHIQELENALGISSIDSDDDVDEHNNDHDVIQNLSSSFIDPSSSSSSGILSNKEILYNEMVSSPLYAPLFNPQDAFRSVNPNSYLDFIVPTTDNILHPLLTKPLSLPPSNDEPICQHSTLQHLNLPVNPYDQYSIDIANIDWNSQYGINAMLYSDMHPHHGSYALPSFHALDNYTQETRPDYIMRRRLTMMQTELAADYQWLADPQTWTNIPNPPSSHVLIRAIISNHSEWLRTRLPSITTTPNFSPNLLELASRTDLDALWGGYEDDSTLESIQQENYDPDDLLTIPHTLLGPKITEVNAVRERRAVDLASSKVQADNDIGDHQYPLRTKLHFYYSRLTLLDAEKLKYRLKYTETELQKVQSQIKLVTSVIDAHSSDNDNSYIDQLQVKLKQLESVERAITGVFQALIQQQRYVHTHEAGAFDQTDIVNIRELGRSMVARHLACFTYARPFWGPTTLSERGVHLFSLEQLRKLENDKIAELRNYNINSEHFAAQTERDQNRILISKYIVDCMLPKPIDYSKLDLTISSSTEHYRIRKPLLGLFEPSYKVIDKKTCKPCIKYNTIKKYNDKGELVSQAKSDYRRVRWGNIGIVECEQSYDWGKGAEVYNLGLSPIILSSEIISIDEAEYWIKANQPREAFAVVETLRQNAWYQSWLYIYALDYHIRSGQLPGIPAGDYNAALALAHQTLRASTPQRPIHDQQPPKHIPGQLSALPNPISDDKYLVEGEFAPRYTEIDGVISKFPFLFTADEVQMEDYDKNDFITVRGQRARVLNNKQILFEQMPLHIPLPTDSRMFTTFMDTLYDLRCIKYHNAEHDVRTLYGLSQSDSLNQAQLEEIYTRYSTDLQFTDFSDRQDSTLVSNRDRCGCSCQDCSNHACGCAQYDLQCTADACSCSAQDSICRNPNGTYVFNDDKNAIFGSSIRSRTELQAQAHLMWYFCKQLAPDAYNEPEPAFYGVRPLLSDKFKKLIAVKLGERTHPGQEDYNIIEQPLIHEDYNIIHQFNSISALNDQDNDTSSNFIDLKKYTWDEPRGYFAQLASQQTNNDIDLCDTGMDDDTTHDNALIISDSDQSSNEQQASGSAKRSAQTTPNKRTTRQSATNTPSSCDQDEQDRNINRRRSRATRSTRN